MVVDSDAPVVGQLLADDEISPAIAIDTLRVDVLRAADGAVLESDVPPEIIVAPERSDWPISFGVRGGGGEVPVRLRLRAFGALHAAGEGSTLEPPPELTIDRVVDAVVPADGVRTLVITLAGDCFGISPDFSSRDTCIDGQHSMGSFADGLTEVASVDAVVSRVGEWERARYRSCESSDDDDRVCIPGGIFILGSDALVGLAETFQDPFDPVPERLVELASFVVDRHEYTVGRFVALMTHSAAALDTLPTPRAPGDAADCTWLGPSSQDRSNDALPLNCLRHATAAKICELEGGRLATEAQWEYVARGRGLGRRHPWGDEAIACCTAAVERLGSAGQCPSWATGPAEVGAHADASACASVDESVDGVLDLAGNVRELMLDDHARYDDACWSDVGIVVEPHCQKEGSSAKSVRGAGWSDPMSFALSARRFTTVASTTSDYVGFRCVYGTND